MCRTRCAGVKFISSSIQLGEAFFGVRRPSVHRRRFGFFESPARSQSGAYAPTAPHSKNIPLIVLTRVEKEPTICEQAITGTSDLDGIAYSLRSSRCQR